MTETREEREVRWRTQHKWDGPMVCIGGIFMVSTCSVCGADATEQRPCEPLVFANNRALGCNNL